MWFAQPTCSLLDRPRCHPALLFLLSYCKYVFFCGLFAAATKLIQSCPTLCNPIDGSLPGSSIPGIPQARILEWVAISSSNACMHAKLLQSCLTLCDPVDSSPQAPPSTRFSRQEYWSGLPFLSPVVYLVPCFLYMGFPYISVGK